MCSRRIVLAAFIAVALGLVVALIAWELLAMIRVVATRTWTVPTWTIDGEMIRQRVQVRLWERPLTPDCERRP